jgi:glycosyltransferase involved in cell wall biosynthesis
MTIKTVSLSKLIEPCCLAFLQAITYKESSIKTNAAMQDNRIKIARIWSKYEGKYESRAGIIIGLNPQRYKTICIYLTKNSTKTNFFEEKGYETFYISKNQSLRSFNFLLIWKLAKILKAEEVDIVHCHKHKSTVYGTLAAMIAHTPVIIAHVHGLNRTRNRQRKLVNFFIMKRVNKILTVGQAVRDDVLKSNPSVPTQKVCSLGNSVDYWRFAEVSTTKDEAQKRLNLPSTSIVFGTVSRLTYAKGLSYLIAAFSKVKAKIHSAQLVIAGDGQFRNDFETQAKNTGLAQSIHFLGRRNDIPQVLRGMDVFVLPSIGEEGLPRALLEAMAAGVPCIGTTIGGIPEIIDDAKFGFLVPPNDSDTLAEAMIKLAEIPDEKRRKLIDISRQKVYSYYTHEVVTKKLEKIYEDVLVCN